MSKPKYHSMWVIFSIIPTMCYCFDTRKEARKYNKKYKQFNTLSKPIKFCRDY